MRQLDPIMQTRDIQADIAKGIGMLMVIGGHCEFYLQGFTPYSFHMPLFYFISGFFIASFINDPTYRIGAFLRKKAIRLLIPYFIYNIIFGFLAWTLQFTPLHFNSGKFLEIFSLHNLFIAPFLSGHQYALGAPLWFVPSLFSAFIIVAMVKPLLAKIRNSILKKLFLIGWLIAIYVLCANVTLPDYGQFVFLARNIIGAIFICFGWLYYTAMKTHFNNWLLFWPSLIIYSIICWKYGLQNYYMYNNDFGQGIQRYIALPIALSGIGVIVGLAGILTERVSTPGILARLGRDSYHIMAIHLSVIVLLSCLLSICLAKPLAVISNPYYHFANMSPLYFTVVTIVSYYYCRCLTRMRSENIARLTALWLNDPITTPKPLELLDLKRLQNYSRRTPKERRE